MALSSGPTSAGLALPADNRRSFTAGKSGFAYAVERDASGFWFRFGREGQPENFEQRRLPYFVGSGAAAMAFLISVDGFLYEAPVAWYRQSQSWGLSPGYENYSYPFLTRAVVPRCLECHAGGVQAIRGTQNGYGSPPFQEPGVTCERCHGSGDAHAARMKLNPRRSGDLDVVNPAKLTPERRDSICAQCHLSGEVVVEKGAARQQTFLPGNRLQDYRISFSRATEGSKAKVASHVENLAQSLCKRASQDRLWCGTCHDPHSEPAAAGRADWFRTKCLACHASDNCSATTPARAAAKNDCVSCHMPKRASLDAQHVVATDHSIPRFGSRLMPSQASTAGPLVAFEQTTVQPRELGLAYGIAAARTGNASDAARALPLLREALLQAPNDPQVLSYLADLYKKRSDDAAAIALYERLLRVEPADVSAPVALGAYALERGNTERAIRFWNSALQKSPALLLVRANLAGALLKVGRPEEARAVLNKALVFNPSFSAVKELLQKLPPVTPRP